LYVDGKTVYQVGNKDKINYAEMHGQQNIKIRDVCLSVRPHGTTWLPVEDFS